MNLPMRHMMVRSVKLDALQFNDTRRKANLFLGRVLIQLLLCQIFPANAFNW
jgi:hypothetical protein